MASSDSELNRGSTTAYSTLVQSEILDNITSSRYGVSWSHSEMVIYPNIICYFGNDKLVVFDRDGQNVALYENFCDVQRRSMSIRSLSTFIPVDSCSTALDGNRFVVVSSPNKSFLTIFSSENPGELKEDGKLNVKGGCHGLDFIDGKLYVCFKDPPKISILDMNTGFIHNIENEPKGNQLFTAPSHIAVDICSNKEVIYVSDEASWGLRRLTKIDTQGNILSSFLSLTAEEPKQVMAVGDGSVLFVLDGIRLMSERCQEVVKLLDETHAGSFTCMCYSKQRHMLFLRLDNTTQIVVYKLT
ncbi:uncharacterized protein LOC128206951 [Mya arenaria]|uniref:uncharacterized protein LOC128206951 n=1 Tax=Mya arenaria TaxID=6604 RepID=UPI0022E21832|nr:uncharacterized protein LOC128206951 [Mya arenaria]